VADSSKLDPINRRCSGGGGTSDSADPAGRSLHRRWRAGLIRLNESRLRVCLLVTTASPVMMADGRRRCGGATQRAAGGDLARRASRHWACTGWVKHAGQAGSPQARARERRKQTRAHDEGRSRDNFFSKKTERWRRGRCAAPKRFWLPAAAIGRNQIERQSGSLKGLLPPEGGDSATGLRPLSDFKPGHRGVGRCPDCTRPCEHADTSRHKASSLPSGSLVLP